MAKKAQVNAAKVQKLGLYGKKIGMTQVYDQENKLVAVTALLVEPCTVVSKKEQKKDGYNALQLGIEDKKDKHANLAELGHVKKSLLKANGVKESDFSTEEAQAQVKDVRAKRFLRELRVNEADLNTFSVGQAITLQEVFEENTLVDISSKTKGRGYQGVIKRWGFHGFPATHGTHEFFRHGGSIGNREFPGRVFKNRKMAGQYGNERVTIQNIKIVKLIPEKNIILLHGAVPGGENGLVLIRKAVKAK